MSSIGRRSLIYAGLILAFVVAGIVLVQSASGTLRVDQSYYQAAASVIPLLLLAHIVRLNAMKESILDDRGQFDSSDARDKAKAQSAADQVSSYSLEIVTAHFATTLVLGSAGLAAVMVALAHGQGSPLTLFLSATAIGWPLLGMLAFEVMLFVRLPVGGDRRDHHVEKD